MKYLLITLMLLSTQNIFGKPLKMKLTVKSFKGPEATYSLDQETGDVNVATNLDNWKCVFKNNKEGSKKIKDTMLAYVKCSVGENSMEYSFSCRSKELRYESFELMDKTNQTSFVFECI